MKRKQKIMFPTEDEARAYVEYCRRKYGAKKFPRTIRYYYAGGGWRFTRMSIEDFRKRRDAKRRSREDVTVT